jgi:hypothetical protein
VLTFEVCQNLIIDEVAGFETIHVLSRFCRSDTLRNRQVQLKRRMMISFIGIALRAQRPALRPPRGGDSCEARSVFKRLIGRRRAT